MNIEQQIVSLQHIAINAISLQKEYPKDEAIKAMLSQAQFMITKLQKQQESELQDRMFIERRIRVNRFRDGGSVDFYLLPQNVKIASFDMYDCRPNKIATCLLSGRSVKVADWKEGKKLVNQFIKESVGIALDLQGDVIGNVTNFKRKYNVSIKPD